MGLHLNYELRLPGHTPADEIDQILLAMRVHAATLPFAALSELIHLQPTENPLDENDRATKWLKLWARLIARPHDEDEEEGVEPYTGDPNTARGFVAHPGTGSETSTFGFLQHTNDKTSHCEWFWYCCCKTQYASRVSDAHLVACHTALTSMLDFAITLGVDVTVRDETQYWETRDEQRLISEVGNMNRIVASFAGRLADVLGGEHEIHAPIFKHPHFEHLEMGE